MRGCPRGGGHVGWAQPRYNAFLGCPKVESSDAVITGILSLYHIDGFMLFDPVSTYSYVSSYFASHLSVRHDSLVSVSTLTGDSIVVDWVYRSCVVTINDFDTIVDLLLLNMVDFKGILGMDWLSQYHAILDCHTKSGTLAMLGLPRLEWRGTLGHSTSKVV
ncbi:uncharacterized protein [Nicotiana tomentosiformis]|uniref:uncharacterized protein n=1 Tax=Nicotiana tomentosiformis TaxID=4098 RepID=UPI00388C3C1E